jgi:hypothetical protein
MNLKSNYTTTADTLDSNQAPSRRFGPHPNNPDLNPIATVWPVVNARVRRQQRPSLEALKQVITQVSIREFSLREPFELFHFLPSLHPLKSWGWPHSIECTINRLFNEGTVLLKKLPANLMVMPDFNHISIPFAN